MVINCLICCCEFFQYLNNKFILSMAITSYIYKSLTKKFYILNLKFLLYSNSYCLAHEP